MFYTLLAEAAAEAADAAAQTATEKNPFEAFIEDVRAFFTKAGLNIVIGILILIVGLIICKIIKVVITRIMRRTKKDEAVVHFVASLIDVILKIVVLVAALATMGINTASIITVLGTCGVAIGLALKDSLGNVAGGMMIIVNKPFKKGDYISATGVEGVVQTINLFNTVLLTVDNKEVVIPNGQLSNSNIINFSAMDKRRVDFEINVACDTDLVKAQNAILSICGAHSKVHSDPEPFCRMNRVADGAIVFTVRAWCDTPDYWTVYFDLQEQIREKFVQLGVVMPYPQLDVHVDNRTK